MMTVGMDRASSLVTLGNAGGITDVFQEEGYTKKLSMWHDGGVPSRRPEKLCGAS